MKKIFSRYRHSCEGRFSHQSDWLRLASLGILVITFAALELMDNLVAKKIRDHFFGGSAIFGGVIIFLIIQKISRTRFYADWTLNAIACIAVGLVLRVDEALDHTYSLVLFCAFLFASGLSRICIGWAAEPEAVASWMLPSGCIALLAACWTVGTRALQLSTMPSNILALDILFQGISIVGVGVSLKQAS